MGKGKAAIQKIAKKLIDEIGRAIVKNETQMSRNKIQNQQNCSKKSEFSKTLAES